MIGGIAMPKGIILAGGEGTRLDPLSRVTNKHLLAVYDKPMIYYPLIKLIKAGINRIMIVTGKGHAGHFVNLLGSGRDFGVKLSYEVQEKAGGIAEALGLCEDFAGGEDVVVLLGDNIFEDELDLSLKRGACNFLKEVPDPHRFGVAEVNEDEIIRIEEKPKEPKSNLAVTGIYLYDKKVFGIIKDLEPSGRNELEITDVNNWYIKYNDMTYKILKGWWTDAGTFESLLKASNLVAEMASRDKFL